MTKKTIAAVLTAGATLALLAGCAGGQSTAAACKQVQGDVQGSVSQMQTEASKFQSDPKGTVKKLKALDEKLSKSIDKVQNDEIKQKGETMEKAFKDVVTQVDSVSKDPQSADVSKLSSATTKLQKAGTAFDKACKS